MFAFAVHPLNNPADAKVFVHPTIQEIAGFDPDILLSIVRSRFGMRSELEKFEFFEIGAYRPITFEKQVSYTLNQA